MEEDLKCKDPGVMLVLERCRVTMGLTSLAPLTSCSLYGGWNGLGPTVLVDEAYMELCLRMMACRIVPASTLSEIVAICGGLRSLLGNFGKGPNNSTRWKAAVVPDLFLACCSTDKERWTSVRSSWVKWCLYTQLGWGLGPGVFRFKPSSSCRFTIS